jgi:hypothetical protein
MQEATVNSVANMIVHNPKLRRDYYANPEKLLTKVAAKTGVQRDQRLQIGSMIEEKLAKTAG